LKDMKKNWRIFSFYFNVKVSLKKKDIMQNDTHTTYKLQKVS